MGAAKGKGADAVNVAPAKTHTYDHRDFMADRGRLATMQGATDHFKDLAGDAFPPVFIVDGSVLALRGGQLHQVEGIDEVKLIYGFIKGLQILKRFRVAQRKREIARVSSASWGALQ